MQFWSVSDVEVDLSDAFLYKAKLQDVNFSEGNFSSGKSARADLARAELSKQLFRQLTYEMPIYL
ncbi:MAG: pentapeptide repeat-containing protein [Caldilineaceae bacterium]